jgi:hypothetical protein
MRKRRTRAAFFDCAPAGISRRIGEDWFEKNHQFFEAATDIVKGGMGASAPLNSVEPAIRICP